MNVIRNVNLYELPQLYDHLFQKYTKGIIGDAEMALLNEIEAAVDEINAKRKTQHM